MAIRSRPAQALLQTPDSGGINSDGFTSCAIDGNNNLYLSGSSNSPQDGTGPPNSYPLWNPGGTFFQANLNLLLSQQSVITTDAVITKLNLDLATYIPVITDENYVTVYPNPTNSYLKISDSDFKDKKCHFKILNLVGQQLIELDKNIDEKIDVSKLSVGLYFLNYECAGDKKTAKFIKE